MSREVMYVKNLVLNLASIWERIGNFTAADHCEIVRALQSASRLPSGKDRSGFFFRPLSDVFLS